MFSRQRGARDAPEQRELTVLMESGWQGSARREKIPRGNKDCGWNTIYWCSSLNLVFWNYLFVAEGHCSLGISVHNPLWSLGKCDAKTSGNFQCVTIAKVVHHSGFCAFDHCLFDFCMKFYPCSFHPNMLEFRNLFWRFWFVKLHSLLPSF